MLVLTRKLGENIVIGNDISVKVIQIENNKVQLGIQAPTAVSIYRQELIEKIKEQNIASLIERRHDFFATTQLLKNVFNFKN